MPDDSLSHQTMLDLGHHTAPHEYLGLHPLKNGSKVIRLWSPHETEAHVELFGQVSQLDQIDPKGIFELKVPPETTSLDYKIITPHRMRVYDPYVFAPTLSETDLFLFSKGMLFDIHKKFGAHFVTHEGCKGVKFAVWAPDVLGVSVVGDFNGWNHKLNPMRRCKGGTVWELFIPGKQAIFCQNHYKFAILTQEGKVLLKSDPFGREFELRPKDASRITRVDSFNWGDREWLQRQKESDRLNRPINIYEIHLGSWRYIGNYRAIAHELVPYIHEMGYTHVEILPISEHPLDESWGYQCTGYYAPSSRYGSPEDFKYFVNYLHQHNVGVILDWVPSHFPKDPHALAEFNGKPLYECDDPVMAEHPHWQTLIFDFRRPEVVNFLIGSALFWIEEMHVDGIRVDAVSSLIYLSFGREKGMWKPNRMGGEENLEAVEFIKKLNCAVKERYPQAMMIAEESSSYPGVTRPVFKGGLGFDLKWCLGWMNDTLRFISRDPAQRKFHHDDITFLFMYVFKEKYVMPLSHDEVVHEKRSLFNKPSGTIFEKCATHKLLYGYAMCCPGKKLFFMGAEFGQLKEWNCKGELDWQLLEEQEHHGIHIFVKELNHLYCSNEALWQDDFTPNGFEWVEVSDKEHSVFALLRKGGDQTLLAVLNFSANHYPRYPLAFAKKHRLKEVINSDGFRYGGRGRLNTGAITTLQLAPLSIAIFEVSSK
ncbi:MAG: 1,4-alpha-glucan branching enzyme GlgB [Chlamydiia bacterium]|nr:1,4-alpha-glucan branching enzyme GlgB [Chlamydiia bacterium]